VNVYAEALRLTEEVDDLGVDPSGSQKYFQPKQLALSEIKEVTMEASEIASKIIIDVVTM